jgi:hypothetical protein
MVTELKIRDAADGWLEVSENGRKRLYLWTMSCTKNMQTIQRRKI